MNAAKRRHDRWRHDVRGTAVVKTAMVQGDCACPGALGALVWMLCVVILANTACGSKGQDAFTIGAPTIENGTRVFSHADANAVALAFSALPSTIRAEWFGFLEQNAAKLRGVGQSVESYCTIVTKLGAGVGAEVRAVGASRWNQLLSACTALIREAASQSVASQRMRDAERVVGDADAELKKLTSEVQAMQREKNAVVTFDGFIIQRFDAHTYEVAEAEVRDTPRRPCSGAADCNAAEFSRMANPSVRPSEDRGILRTTKSVFESTGRFSLRVLVKGTEKRTNTAGFAQEFVVLEEAEGVDGRLAEEVNRRLQRVREIDLDVKKAMSILSEPDDQFASARMSVLRQRVDELLTCQAAGSSACARGAATGVTDTPPVIAPVVTAMSLDASSTTDLVAKVVELTPGETATVDVPTAASVSTRWAGGAPGFRVAPRRAA